MSSVNYNLKNRGVRLISSDEAWVRSKKGTLRLNSKFTFVGKLDTRMPNMLVTVSDKTKPKYCGNTCDLNSTAKGQIIDHFFNEQGKRNRKTVAYFGILKKTKKQTGGKK